MKLTTQQFTQFKQYASQGINNSQPDLPARIDSWLTKIGDEKLSHFNALHALSLVKRAGDEAYFWIQSFNFNDSVWATVGRAYFKWYKNIAA